MKTVGLLSQGTSPLDTWLERLQVTPMPSAHHRFLCFFRSAGHKKLGAPVNCQAGSRDMY
jgi:hypothetical protein